MKIDKYIPIISIRPSEVVALSELPDLSKDRMTPLVLIKPWLGAGALSRAVDKICHGYPDRPWFAELDPEYELGAGSDAYDEIQRLRDPSSGFENWISFVETYGNAIPVLQLRGSTPESLHQQIDRAKALGRGVCCRLLRNVDLSIKLVVQALVDRNVEDCVFVLDYGQQDYRLLANLIPAIADVALVKEQLPKAQIAISATSFPANFSEITSQVIFEREFFEMVQEEVDVEDLIYSDRGGARAVEQGGGGVPRPRIDLPGLRSWHFFRSDCVREARETDDEFRRRRMRAYQEMANNAVHSAHWDASLNIWGTQLIKITQLGSAYGITSPAKATACRLNIHLARQSLYGDEISAEELEEDWVD